MSDSKDTIYANTQSDETGKISPFKFDQRVANVFTDMISRSVPSYQPILAMLPTITREFRMHQHRYYDLGCSLGAGLHAMAEGLKSTPELAEIQTSLIGVDNSEAMLERARTHECPYNNVSVEFIEQDILDTSIEQAAMVLMNFTLQFIAPEHRNHLITRVYEGLVEGGAFILSEKITFANTKTNDAMTNIHHRYKADQGYSQLEISQKRDSIENVLIPETLETHLTRLESAGFSVVTPWLQNLQFISILAIK